MNWKPLDALRPPPLPITSDMFTSREYAKHYQISLEAASKNIKRDINMGILELVTKRGNTFYYRIVRRKDGPKKASPSN